MSSADALSVAARMSFAAAHGQVAVLALGTQAQLCLACFAAPVPAAWQVSWGDATGSSAHASAPPSAAWQAVAHCMAQEPAAVVLLLDQASEVAQVWALPWAQALQSYGVPLMLVELQSEAADAHHQWQGGVALRAACQGWLQVPPGDSPECGAAPAAAGVADPVQAQAAVAGHFYELLQASLAVGVSSFELQDILDCMAGTRSRMRLVAEQAATPEEALRRIDAVLEGLDTQVVQQAGIFIQPGQHSQAAVGNRSMRHLNAHMPDDAQVVGAAWRATVQPAHTALTLITSEDPQSGVHYAS